MLLFTCLSIALIFMDYRGGYEYFKQARSMLSVTVVPIQYLVDGPAKMIGWLATSFADSQNLQDENMHLRVQVLLLQTQLQKLIILEKENTQLRALLQSYPRTSERVLVAQLLSINSDSFLHEIILNQGSRVGAYVGQPVLDATGVIGQVIAVSPYTSRVLLLTDTRSAIAAQDTRNNIRGIVVGTGDSDSLKLARIPTTANVQVGDIFVTSGLDAHFAPGYSLGVVTKIDNNPGQGFSDITIKPNAEINQSRLVLLVWPHDSLALEDDKTLSMIPETKASPSKRARREKKSGH
jgi:rod shape-determining protein MreC